MKKCLIFLALALCVCFSVALSASTMEAPEPVPDVECPADPDVILDNEDVIPDDYDSDPTNAPLESPLPDSVEPTSPLVQNPIVVDNSAIVQSIQGLQQSLLINQSPSFDNMTLLSYVDSFGFDVVEKTEDFALLFFFRSNSFVLVSHDSIVNLGVFQ